MRDFRSVWVIQIRLVRAPPQQQNGIIKLERVSWKGFMKIVVSRMKPYPPSFRRIAARIIEPATGASTCALGSQRCSPNMGTFTRKAIRQRMARTVFPLSGFFLNSGIDRWPVFLYRTMRAISSGRDLIKV